MKVDKFDIGAEVISILTRGMYPDPRDAVREYIQNAIDAGSTSVDVKVRTGSVVIEDDGSGMDYKTLRRSVRIGISDKKPGKDIGFMGIGIYSSFHLCDALWIYTKKVDILPQLLKIDFRGMRELLDAQKKSRLEGKIQSADLKDLQTLLQEFIELPEEGSVALEEYPIPASGTRVELVGLNPVLDDYLNNFDELSNYLQDVVPLHFNKKKFKWAELIEKKLKEVIEYHKESFELIDLKLQVGTNIANLYRPYTDDIFSNDLPFEPDFQEIKSGNTFLGIAWGCLNSSRERILLPSKDETKRNLRGFIIKKQGFSIGNREVLSKYFGNSNTYYHRYTGEIIIVNKEILPNAARNDLETSDLKKVLVYQIQNKVAPYFIKQASKFQEEDKANEQVRKEIANFTDVLGQYNEYEDNYNVYLLLIKRLDNVVANIGSKIKKLTDEDRKQAEIIKAQAVKLKNEVTQKIVNQSKKKKNNTTESTIDPKVQIADSVSSVKIVPITTNYETLIELFSDLDVDLSYDAKRLVDIIDDLYLKGPATTKTEYYQFLNQIREEFDDDNN
ncbi:ATP-binding protein [uncultured Mucilaginibacter sp.]|uniref:ATP-binding protein n=1 Tax=uncultured Mucilaginibacter sp. TaxID=797541 RepID=UPI00261F0FA9|nr:ATP-binding protein [uncultured Mucilaginibacter sp.]